MIGGGALRPDGIWFEVRGHPTRGAHRPALFLDRDGVLVEEVHYLSRAEDVRMLPSAAGLIARANACTVPVIVVTNQAGIGRGLYDWAAFAAVEARIREELESQGAYIDAVLACPFHADAATSGYRHPDHPFRKPNPGMLLCASQGLALDLSRSWMVGDKVTDVLAARAARLDGSVHVLTGHGLRDRGAVQRVGGLQVAIAEDAEGAMDFLPILAGGPS